MPGAWIEMDDRTSYRINDDGTVTVSSSDDVDANDTRLIAESLGMRLGGTWSMRAGEWSSADGESEITAVWRKAPRLTREQRDAEIAAGIAALFTGDATDAQRADYREGWHEGLRAFKGDRVT